MPAIEILGLEKTYLVGFWRKRPKCALLPLHLAVEDGEIFGFLGPNGAGKTTTFEIADGTGFPYVWIGAHSGPRLDRPGSESANRFPPRAALFLRSPDRARTLELLRSALRSSGEERTRRVESTLQRVGLPDVKGVQLRKFSKGMLQRVGIAQAILHDPKLVFFDEPMSGLDPMGRREVRDLMEQLKHEGKTVFFSTHILSDAEALCDRVAIIHKGELRGTGRVADLTSSVLEQSGSDLAGHAGSRIDEGAGRGVPRHRRYGARHH